MGIVARQGFKGTIVIYIGVFIGAVNLLFLGPKFLTPTQIGLIRVLLEISILFSGLSQFGVSNITDKFFSFFRNDEKKHQGFLLLILIYSFIGYLIVLSTFIFLKHLWISAYQEKSPFLIEYFYHVIPLSFFILFMTVLEAYCRVHMRIVVPSIIREIFLKLVFSIVVILYHFKGITFEELILYVILSYLVGIIFLLSYIKKLNRLYLFSLINSPDKNLIKEIIKYGSFIFLAGASGLIASKIDLLILSREGLYYTGVYSIAFFIATIIEIPRRAFSQISSPLIAQFWIENNISSIESIYKKTSLNQFIIGLFLFLLIWINVDFILALIPNSEIYKTGKYVILFIGISRLADMASGVNTEIIVNSPFYKINLGLTVVSAVLTISANYVLIPLLGMNGAALASTASFVVMSLIKILIIYRKERIQPFGIGTLWVLLIGVVTYIALWLISFNVPSGEIYIILTILIQSLIVILLFIVPVLFFRISEEFNSLFMAVIKFRGKLH